MIAVGWLGAEHPFTRGTVSKEFYSRLQELMARRFEPVATAGVHRCELCQFDAPAAGGNLFVPDGERMFVAPELIVHYIAAHHYQPPEPFIRAVMQCPTPGGMDYRRRFLAAGGGTLS